MTSNARPDGYTSRMKQAAKATAFDHKVEFNRETDGRWIADNSTVSAAISMDGRIWNS
jgi:hypothetical protein